MLVLLQVTRRHARRSKQLLRSSSIRGRRQLFIRRRFRRSANGRSRPLYTGLLLLLRFNMLQRRLLMVQMLLFRLLLDEESRRR